MTEQEFRERLAACKMAARLGVDDTWAKLRAKLLQDLEDERYQLRGAVVRLSLDYERRKVTTCNPQIRS